MLLFMTRLDLQRLLQMQLMEYLTILIFQQMDIFASLTIWNILLQIRWI